MAWKKSGLILVILLIGFAASKVLTNISTISESKLTPESFPLNFKGWTGKDVEVSDDENTFLPEDTLFVKRYFSKPGVGGVYLVVVFSGKDRRSIHRPEVCYPSQGWTINNKKDYVIDVDHPIKSLKTTLLDITFRRSKEGRSDMVVYWFMGNNRVTGTHLKRVILTGLDRCMYGQNYRWAFLRLSTPVSKTKEQALGVMEKFVQDLFPYIADDSYSQF